MPAFKIRLTFGYVFLQIGSGQGWRLSRRKSALQKVECINALGRLSALNIFLNCQFCLRRVNYISLLWLIEDWFNKAAISVNGPVYFLTVFTERLWGEKRGEKTQLQVQILIPVLQHLLAELYLGISLFRVVCNYFATDITKHTITMWLFLSIETRLIAYNRFCRYQIIPVYLGWRVGRKEWGREERERKKERLLYLVEYHFLYTNLNTRVVILFLGNDDLSQIWYLCKGDSLVFLRHENKLESSCVTAVNPLLEGIQMLWWQSWHRPCGKGGNSPRESVPRGYSAARVEVSHHA